MNTKTQWAFKTMNILSWIVFIGLCIKAGAILCAFLVSIYINPAGARNLHLGLNLSNLYSFNTGHYTAVVLSIVLLSALKACIFYLVVKIFLKINFVHPFSTAVLSLISSISYVAVGTGLLALLAERYCGWLVKAGVVLPSLEGYLDGSNEFLLLGGVIFIIAQVFKKGVDIQTESELTV